MIVNRRYPDKIKKRPIREPKDENEIFKNCLYPKIKGKHSFPGAGLKKCAVDAAHTFSKVAKKKVRGTFFIPVDYVPIIGDEPVMRKDVGRIQGKSAIEIIRAEFKEWEMIFPVQFDENGALPFEIIANLFAIGGNCVGIGDWRPAHDGTHGRFKIVESKMAGQG